jgi:hypothetical protein
MDLILGILLALGLSVLVSTLAYSVCGDPLARRGAINPGGVVAALLTFLLCVTMIASAVLG